MKETMVKGPGGWYIRNSDEKDIRLNQTLKDAFSTDYRKSMDYMSDYNHKGKDRLHFKKGGEINIKRPGALHRELDIPEDKKIPLKTLNKAKKKAEETDNTRLMKQVTFAKNFRGK